jgi:nitrous-oxide reductase
MADETKTETPSDNGRRKFLNTAGIAGLAGAGISLGLAGCNKADQAAPATAPTPHAGPGHAKGEVAPGQLDEYYMLSSGGHSGEARIYGVPSGRTIKRIPVFNIDPMSGWGITNESKKIIGTKADGSLKYITGDTHHVHGSYNDGTYDGKYFWINDKINNRLARIRGDYMECDKITQIPNVQGFHGIFPDKRDPADQSHDTRLLRCRVPRAAAQYPQGLAEPGPLRLPDDLHRRRNHGSALAGQGGRQHGPVCHLL